MKYFTGSTRKYISGQLNFLFFVSSTFLGLKYEFIRFSKTNFYTFNRVWNTLTRGCLREEIYIWSINEYRAHKRKSKEKKYSKSVSNREDDISTLDNADWERNISPSNGGECSYARRNCIQRYPWKMNIFIYCTPYYFSAAWLEFKTYSEHRVNYFAPPLFSKIYTVFPQFCYVQKSRSICWFKNETNIYIYI